MMSEEVHFVYALGYRGISMAVRAKNFSATFLYTLDTITDTNHRL